MNTRIWSLFEAFVFYIAYLASGLLARLSLLVFYSIYFAVGIQRNHEIFHAQEFFSQVISAVESSPLLILLLANLIVVLIYSLIIRIRGERFSKYTALGMPPFRNIFGAAISGVGIYFIVQFLLGLILQGSLAKIAHDSYLGTLMDENMLLMLASAMLAAPIVEEIVFRGAIFRALERSLGGICAVLITATLFALSHTDPVQMAYAFVIGILFGIVRARSGKLVPCIIMHIGFNCANLISGDMPDIWAISAVTAAGYLLSLHRKSKKIEFSK